ncbi:hypothetical protein KKF45_04690 [Patescibacteria group bacterium]|nr:hypothetical protein [Patescibacteria group bacterium]
MTWTYSGDPAASDLDQVRFLIGDTDTLDQQLSNEEIAWLLSNQGSPLGAAIAACEQVGAIYARKVSQSTGGISVSYGDRQSYYADLANRLRRRMRVAPYVGGISLSDIASNEGDSDWDQPVFSVGMMSAGGTEA